MGQDILFHGKSLFVLPTTNSDHIALPPQPEHLQILLWPPLLIESTKLASIPFFSEFLTAGGSEGGIQIHLDTAYHLGGDMKKSIS